MILNLQKKITKCDNRKQIAIIRAFSCNRSQVQLLIEAMRERYIPMLYMKNKPRCLQNQNALNKSGVIDRERECCERMKEKTSER